MDVLSLTLEGDKYWKSRTIQQKQYKYTQLFQRGATQINSKI